MVRRCWLVVRFLYEDVMERQDYVRQVLVDLVRVRASEAVRLASA